MYIVRKQSKGMQHIRNLKSAARKLWEHYDKEPELWEDCIESSMRQCRIALNRAEIKRQEVQNELIADMTYREYVLNENSD